METPIVVILLVAIAVIVWAIVYAQKGATSKFEQWKAIELDSARRVAENSARVSANLESERRFEAWKLAEVESIRRIAGHAAQLQAQAELEKWKIEEEKKIRSDAINRSGAVTLGRVTEHLVPFFPDFPYNPKDARFIGSPVDLLVFNGLYSGGLTEIVFIEVKTGSSRLNENQRAIRNAIEEGRVVWKEHGMPTSVGVTECAELPPPQQPLQPNQSIDVERLANLNLEPMSKEEVEAYCHGDIQSL